MHAGSSTCPRSMLFKCAMIFYWFSNVSVKCCKKLSSIHTTPLLLLNDQEAGQLNISVDITSWTWCLSLPWSKHSKNVCLACTQELTHTDLRSHCHTHLPFLWSVQLFLVPAISLWVKILPCFSSGGLHVFCLSVASRCSETGMNKKNRNQALQRQWVSEWVSVCVCVNYMHVFAST